MFKIAYRVGCILDDIRSANLTETIQFRLPEQARSVYASSPPLHCNNSYAKSSDEYIEMSATWY